MVLDLDGDGVELTALDNPDGSSLSNVYFDLDGNGFAERTGWVSSDDGILVRDINQNSTVDNVTELFGSSTVDGFTKLETLDANMDGKIDASDAAFSELRVWRDFNQNGVSEVGELFTLAEMGISQISVQTQDATGTNAGHDLGVTSLFTRTDGSTGEATSVWFQTDNQDTVPDEAGFVPVADVAALPQLPRSGNLHSATWVASNDVDFKSHMTALVQNAATMSAGELRSSFESLLLEWANVDGVIDGSRGAWVDARHLAFVESFFGTGFTLANGANATILHSPSTAAQGTGIEASFDQIVDTLLTVFLAQVPASQIAAGADFAAVIANPFFFYSLIDFRDPATITEPAETPGNLGLVLSLIKAMAPASFAASVDYYTKALAPLQGVATFAFAGDNVSFKSFVASQFNDITDETLKAIAIASASGNGEFGTVASEALIGSDSNDVFNGSGGNDIILSGAGSDIFIYSKGDGADVIRERTVTANDLDVLVLKDIVASEVTYQRAGEALNINIAGGGSLSVEGFFHDWANQSGGLDVIRFSDGTTADRTAIQVQTVSVNVVPDIIVDSTLDDTIRGGLGHDQISIGQGSDRIIWSKGDGYDIISDTNAAGVDTLDLVDVKVGEATVSQAGNNLLVNVNATGEVITIVDFFNGYAAGANHGIDQLRFADGIVWNRETIHAEAWIRGTNGADGISDTSLNDTIEGNAGADSISLTLGGNDTVHWSVGDSDDSIYASSATDTGVKTLVLDDLNPSDVIFSFQGTTLLLTVKATGEVIRVSDQFLHAENLLTTPSTDNFGLDLIRFANGATLDRAGINQRTGSDFVGLSFHNVDPNAVTIPYLATSSSSTGGSGQSPSGSSGVTIQINYGSQTDEFGNVYALDVWGLSDPSIRNGYGTTTVAPTLLGPVLLDNVRLAFAGFASGSQVATSGDLTSLIDQLNTDSNPLVDDDNYNVSPAGLIDFPPDNNRGGIIVSLYSDIDLAVSFLGTNFRDVFLGSRIVNAGGQLDDVVFTADGDDTIYGYEGDDILSGGKGNDIVDGGDGIDLITGGDGSDLLYAGKGNDAIHGGDGSDYLFGDKGNDVLVGGQGDDALQGGEGSDTYVYHLGDGNDRIQDAELLTSAEFEVLKLADIASTGVEFTRIGNDLLIKILATSETITVVNQLSSQHFAIEQIQFSDGINFNASDIKARLVVNGTDGRDIITGTTSSEKITGGLGDDFLVGNSGSDTFVYHAGDGNDEIKELFTTPYTDTDTLKLADLNQSQIELSRVGNDMILTTLATGETVKVVNQFGTDTNIVEKLEFANGMVWLAADFKYHLTLRGTNVADTLTGSSSGETMVGDSGNDSLTGAGGSDIYLYRRGDGTDTIIENSADQYNGVDRLKLADIAASEVELMKTGTNNLLVKIAGTTETILLVAQTYQYNSVIEEIEFSDGTVWNSAAIRYWMNEGSPYYGGTNVADTLIGSYLDQTLEGGMGNDTIDGKAGIDFLFGGTGNDTLVMSVVENGIYDRLDGGDGTDTLSLDTLGVAVDVDLVTNNGEVRTGWASTLPVGALSLVATVTSLEKINGTAYDDAIRADANANTINAGAGSDYIDGRSGNDILNGGAGNDTIYGNTGDDTVDGGSGSDYLDGGLGYDTLTYANSSAAITVNLATGAASGGDAAGDTVIGFEYVTGTGFDDTFTGSSANNTFLGGNGNDVFNVSGGIDTFNGGAGNDTAIFDGFNFAVWIDLTYTSMEVYHRNGTNVISGSWQSMVNLVDVENVVGTSYDDEMTGNTWANTLFGGAGNDKIIGGAGIDVLNGGLGNDTFTGGTESDRYAYSSGIFGNDFINDYQDGLDKIDLTGSGLTFSSFTASQIGSDTVLSYFDGTNTSTIKLAGIAIAAVDASDFIV